MSQDDSNPGGLKDPDKDVSAAGLELRRRMFGVAATDQQVEGATDFTRPLQDMVNRYCFGEVWNRPALDHKTRSMLTLALLTALGKQNQLRVHVKGAIQNGVSKEEIREVLMHSMVYAGLPAAVDSFATTAEVLKQMGLE
jgi:4-carboxymuconolactone decarboxylase